METKQLTDTTIALFFTYGVSLDLWEKKGMLGRELAIYKRLGPSVKRIYFITYHRDDARFADELAQYNITVLPKKWLLPNLLYSFLIPFVYKKELRSCNALKTNQMLGSWVAVLAKKLYKKALIVRTGYSLSIFSKRASKIKYWLSNIIEAIALPSADIFVVATEEERAFYATKHDHIRVIPNYVDTDIFRPLEKKHSKESTYHLLCIGRLSLQKNLAALIQAVATLEDVHLDIIGTGELKDEFVALVEETGASVSFLGNKPHDELPQYIANADIFVLPSHYEGNPKVLLEAMSCGAAVLTTDVPGIAPVVSHKETAYVVQTDAASLAAGIRALCDDEALRTQMGAQARAYIIEHNSLDATVAKEHKHYV